MREICFGTAPIVCASDGLDDRRGVATLRAAREAGIRDFDTAPSYGDGEAERLLGLAASEWDRSSFTVSSKVGRLRMAVRNPYATGSAADGNRAAFDFGGEGVRRTVVRSLERLGMGHLDTVYLHDPDQHRTIAVQQALPELRRLRDEGMVGRIGVATTDPDTACWFVERRLVDVVMLAGAWSLARRAGGRVLDVCVEREIPIVAAAPFASGLLASSSPGDASFFYRTPSEAASAGVEALAVEFARRRVDLGRAALQFPLRSPAVEQVVVGMAIPDEVAENVVRMRERIEDSVWPELDSLVAGSGLIELEG